MLILRHRFAITRDRVRVTAMSASASRDEALLPGRPGLVGGLGTGRGIRLVWVEAMLAVAAFAALCAVVLSVAPQLGVEPDDGAYRASIVAMTEGQFLTLSSAQANALAAKLGDGPGPPSQWVELSGGCDGYGVLGADGGNAALAHLVAASVDAGASQPGILLVDSLARVPLRSLVGMQDKEWLGPAGP